MSETKVGHYGTHPDVGGQVAGAVVGTKGDPRKRAEQTRPLTDNEQLAQEYAKGVSELERLTGEKRAAADRASMARADETAAMNAIAGIKKRLAEIHKKLEALS